MIEQKKILISRTDNLGDSILTLPLISSVKKSFPNYEIKILAKEYTKEVFENSRNVKNVITIPNKFNLINFVKLIAEIKNNNFEMAFLVYPRFLILMVLKFARIKKIIGSGYRWYSFLINEKVFEHRKESVKHEAEYNLGLLKQVDSKLDLNLDFDLTINANSKNRIAGIIKLKKLKRKNFIVIHPLSFGSAPKWKLNNFIELAEKIENETKYKIVFTGNVKEGKILSEKIKKRFEIISDLKIMELASLIENAKCFISNSTGPLHLAAIFKTPVVSFYSSAKTISVKRWGPITKSKKLFISNSKFCNFCKNENCISDLCFEQFKVCDVFTAVKELIN